MIRMVSIFIYSKKILLKKNIFDKSKLFSNATLIWAIKCKVGDFAQELVGTLLSPFQKPRLLPTLSIIQTQRFAIQGDIKLKSITFLVLSAIALHDSF